jgi:hemolysin III
MSDYLPKEEKINVISHAVGFFLSIIALIVLVIHASSIGNALPIISVTIYGLSLIILFAASTLYHNEKDPKRRKRLKIFDHSAIYVLIAGTYTPFTLITLEETVGWTIFGVVWGMALIGIVFKLFFTGKYKLVSTLMYILMGWVIIFAIKPLMESLPTEGLYWLFGGGLAYTVGAILYSIKKIKFNHAIFHFCVLIGSFCHFYAVLYYVLP